jgi:hypothetical protein
MRGNPVVDTRLLVVFDDSVASRRAVKYVGKFVGKRRGFRICLVQVLPPLPPELQEHGGSEDAAKEARLEAHLKAEQHHWISAAKKTAQKGLDQARATLRKAGFRLELCKLCSPNQEKVRTRLTIFSTWLGGAVVARSLSAGSRFPGFTSYSAMNCRKNFFAGAKGSVFGPSNDPGSARTATAWRGWHA